MFYNNKLEFIIIVVKRHKIHLQRSNFNLNIKTKFNMSLHILDEISKVPCTSIKTQK